MPTKRLTLSLIIPTYNEEHHLKDCLDSIAAQSLAPEEVIVVDNNSTDNTTKIAKSYAFVRLLHEPHQGVLYARDKGFNAAKSEIIGRIDADTVLPPNWVETLNALFTDQKYAAVTGPVFYYDMPISPANYWIDHQIRLHLYQHVSGMPFLFGSNAAVRRSAWEKVKPELCQTRTVHEDLDLAIHLVKGGMPIRYDRRLLVGVSSRRYDDTYKQFRRYMGMYLESYRYHGLGNIGPRLATGAYWIGFFALGPLRRSYNDVTKKRSLKQFMQNRRARKNPMAAS